MEAQWIAVMIAGGMLMLSIMGVAFKIGTHAARINRNEKDIAKFDESVKESLRRLHEKFDKLPCKNVKWKKEDCE